MTSQWIELRIETSVDAGELLGLLSDLVVQGAWQENGSIRLYWPESQWNSDRLAKVQATLKQLDPAASPAASIFVDRLPHQDWNRLSTQSVKPLRIGRRLVIHPSWESVELQPHETGIILDPKQAFGTGHHATTRMTLEWLDDHVRGGEAVLDVGAGSGILAMAALRLGAASAIGVDTDPVAVECARDYASGNGFGGELEFVCGTLSDLDGRIRPDLVLANLDLHTLWTLADGLVTYGMGGARLLLSGLLIDQECSLVAEYSRRGLYPAGRRELDGWVALAFACPEPCEGLG